MTNLTEEHLEGKEEGTLRFIDKLLRGRKKKDLLAKVLLQKRKRRISEEDYQCVHGLFNVKAILV